MTRHTFAALVPVAALALLSLGGCQRSLQPPHGFVVGQNGETFEQEAAVRAVQSEDGPEVLVDAQTMARCPGVRPARYVADSAETKGELRGTLESVAACLREGASVGRTAHLRAEAPRAESSHRNADRVEEALLALGARPDQVEVETQVVPVTTTIRCQVMVSIRDEGRQVARH